MAEWLRAYFDVAEDCSSVPSTHVGWSTASCNSFARGSNNSGLWTDARTSSLLSLKKSQRLGLVNDLVTLRFGAEAGMKEGSCSCLYGEDYLKSITQITQEVD